MAFMLLLQSEQFSNTSSIGSPTNAVEITTWLTVSVTPP